MDFLDIRTLSFILFVISFLLGSIYLYFSHIRKNYPGTRELAYSLLVISASMVLFSMQNVIHPFWSVVVGIVLNNVGSAYTPYGLRKFFGYDTRAGYYVTLISTIFVLIFYNVIIVPENVKSKLIIVCLAGGIIFIESFYLLFFNGDRNLKKIARAASMVYLLLALSMFIRIPFIIFFQKVSFNMASAPAGTEKALYIFTLMIGIVCTISAFTLFILMVNFRLEGELIESEEKIRGYAGELEKSNAAKSRFLSIISHDLRNPVDGMASLLGVMAEERGIPEAVAADISILKTTSDGLSALLANLLDWARAQTGTIDVRPERLDLSEMLAETSKILEIRARRKKINLKFEGLAGIFIFADRKMALTILRNILSNAIKFTREGGSVTVTAEAGPREVKIVVHDNGVGMKSEMVEKLFKLDRTGYYSTGTAGEQGTGLGLLICREFAEINGGGVSVSSIEGAGTAVTLALPAPSPENGAPKGPTPVTAVNS